MDNGYGNLRGLQEMAHKKALQEMAGEVDKHIAGKVPESGIKRVLPKEQPEAEEHLLPEDFDERLMRFLK